MKTKNIIFIVLALVLAVIILPDIFAKDTTSFSLEINGVTVSSIEDTVTTIHPMVLLHYVVGVIAAWLISRPKDILNSFISNIRYIFGSSMR